MSNTLTVYNYDNTTKQYTHESTVYADAFGDFNMPAYSTAVEPIIPENHIAVWNGTGWDYEEVFAYIYMLDEDGFVSETGTIEFKTNTAQPSIHHKVVDGEWVLDDDSKLDEDKLIAKALVNSRYLEQIAPGVDFNGFNFDADEDTAGRLSARYNRIKPETSVSAELKAFCDSSNILRTFTKVEMQDLCIAVHDFSNHLGQQRAVFKGLIGAAADNAALDAIVEDINKAW